MADFTTKTRTLGSQLEAEAQELQRRAKERHQETKDIIDREIHNWEVVQTNADNVRGDMVSLILNAKPKYMNEDQWFAEIESRGGCRKETYRRWRNMEVNTPQTLSCYNTLHAIGLDFYIGKRR